MNSSLVQSRRAIIILLVNLILLKSCEQINECILPFNHVCLFIILFYYGMRKVNNLAKNSCRILVGIIFLFFSTLP